MALKPLHLLSLIFFLVLISPIALSLRDTPSDHKPTSPYHFIKDLQGCHKGNSTKGLNKLKHYLKKFGYLQYQNQTHLDNDDFDYVLESALKTYQQNYHIPPTGMLDATTVSKMATPRCGVPDIVNGVNTMPRKKHDAPSPKSIHTVANYAFFPNSPRWPPTKTQLTYSFINNMPSNAMSAVDSAFEKWASASQYFTFSRANSNEQTDLSIGFFSGEHGDGSAFDGPGGTIGHAFAPTDGRFHYDADENWGNGAEGNALDLESVALHEIGHLLGLGHSSVQDAVMYPGIAPGTVKGLNEDDIQGIRALYSS